MTMSRLEINVTDSDRRVLCSTSKGDQLKFNKNGYWIKINKFGYEDLAEVVASRLLDFSTVSSQYISYDLCDVIYNGERFKGCVSKDFLKPNQEIYTFYRIMKMFNIKLPENLNYRQVIFFVIGEIKKYTGVDTTNYLKDIFTLDALILNEDRHLNNLALIYDSSVDAFFECPIFDNGLSLLSDIQIESGYPTYIPVTVSMNNVKAKPFSDSFDKQLGVFGPSFKVSLEGLSTFIEKYKSDLGRIYDVLDNQIFNYPDIITDVYSF